jgi:anti-sigma28 factor (negative regulator of flagellin synthesis)
MLCKICNKNETDNTSGICWQCVEFSKVKENLIERIKQEIKNGEKWKTKKLFALLDKLKDEK